MTVAFLGLGAMGYPMAARLAAAGPVLVWNRTAEVAARHCAEHGSTAIELGHLTGVDTVVSCLTDSAAVAEVVRSARTSLPRGAVWVDCTSGTPEQSRRIAAELGDSGIRYLDAPVSGMAHGARAGTLSMIVGGDQADLESVRPVLTLLAAEIIHVGPVGAGHAVKAANNALFAVSMWAAAEALRALAANGVGIAQALPALNASSGRSSFTESFLPQRILARGAESSFELGTLAKDVRTFVGLDAGAEGSLLASVADRLDGLRATAGASADARATFAAMASAVDRYSIFP